MKPFTILLIDDLDTVAQVLASGLQNAGYRVITALGGQQGIDLFAANQVDLVLCDLCMPDMNGLDVAREVRQLCSVRELKKPPVILITGSSDQIAGDHRIGNAGVDAVIGKPVDIKELLSLTETTLRKNT